MLCSLKPNHIRRVYFPIYNKNWTFELTKCTFTIKHICLIKCPLDGSKILIQFGNSTSSIFCTVLHCYNELYMGSEKKSEVTFLDSQIAQDFVFINCEFLTLTGWPLHLTHILNCSTSIMNFKRGLGLTDKCKIWLLHSVAIKAYPVTLIYKNIFFVKLGLKTALLVLFLFFSKLFFDLFFVLFVNNWDSYLQLMWSPEHQIQ